MKRSTSQVPPEKAAREQLFVAFKRHVGDETGLQSLRNTPSFTKESGEINPDWVEYTRTRNKKTSSAKPGRLVPTPDGEWCAEDPNSPIGRIERLKEEAKRIPEGQETAFIKEARARARLAEVFNEYAGERFNGVRDVVTGGDFSRMTGRYIASRSLSGWRDKLVRTRQQMVEPVLFDKWEEAPLKVNTPTRADKFCKAVLTELVQAGITQFPTQEKKKEEVDTHTYHLSEAAQVFRDVLTFPQSKGYITIANLFYGGDMKKTYINVSAVAQMTGSKVPEGWQQFHGNTQSFTRQRDWVLTHPHGSAKEFQKDCLISGLSTAQINLSVLRKSIAESEL